MHVCRSAQRMLMTCKHKTNERLTPYRLKAPRPILGDADRCVSRRRSACRTCRTSVHKKSPSWHPSPLIAHASGTAGLAPENKPAACAAVGAATSWILAYELSWNSKTNAREARASVSEDSNVARPSPTRRLLMAGVAEWSAPPTTIRRRRPTPRTSGAARPCAALCRW